MHRVVWVNLGEAHAVRRVRRVRQRRAASVPGSAVLLLMGEVVRPLLRREEGLRVQLLQCGMREVLMG